MMKRYEKEWGNKTLTIETGKLAEQADGAVTVRYGDTLVMITACVNPQPRDADFLPLTVDYEERLYAAGKIPGGFFRREGRPSQEAILISRLTDRPLRPLFPKDFRNEIQVVITVLSTDQENEPDVLAILGASTAVAISSIPFAGPVCASRVGQIDGKFVLNPTFSETAQSTIDMIVAGTRQGVVMIESGSMEIDEATALKAVKFGQEANMVMIELQEQIIRELGKPKMQYKGKSPSPELQSAVSSIVSERLGDHAYWKSRQEREAYVDAMGKEISEKYKDSYKEQEIKEVFESAVKAAIRATILSRGIRADSRKPNEIRPITCEVGVLPRTHGSGLFHRGQTQVLTIATLGSLREMQQIDTISQEETKRFMHHYNFPGFSTGETKRIGSPGRREIGHGALAERALVPVIPNEEDFPYTIRLVSEVLSSNGSTSMGATCGSTLALMDAGVPIKAPVSGIAMGLVSGEGKHVVLTDIEGLEDFYGDMDFKVAGTAVGITAIQLDLKLKSISQEILEQAFSDAKTARMFILDKMKQAIEVTRPELSKYAPRMTKLTIDPDKIRLVIGPGGKTIRQITEEAKVTMDVESDGTVVIGSPSEEATHKAIKMIQDLTRDVEVGGVYTGRVTRVTNFGAFVEVLPGKEGLVHISELAEYPVSNVEEVAKIGDEIMVVVTEIDRLGRINLSRRALFAKKEPGEGGTEERREPVRGRGPMPPRRPEGGFPPRPRPQGPPPRRPQGPN